MKLPIGPWLGMLMLAMLAGKPRAAQPATDAPYYPPPEDRGGWRALVTPNAQPTPAEIARVREVAGLDWNRLREAWDYSRQFGGPSRVVVIRHGWIAGEWSTEEQVRGIASCTKSLTSLAVAKLCELSATGKTRLAIHFDDPAWKYLPPSWAEQDPGRKAILIKHLLTMSSGLDPYDGPYQDREAYADLILSRRMEAEPGKVWAYASAPVDLLSLIVEHVSGQKLGDFFNAQIAEPIGAAPVVFSTFRDHSAGSGGPSGGARLAPRDLARIGYLLLHRGRWHSERGDQQILRPETVSRITQWAPELATATYRLPNLGPPGDDGALHYYGYLFWTNRTQQGLGQRVPADAFYMSGWGKQICCVIPSLDMVVVRLGPHRPHNEQRDYYPRFLTPIIAAVVDDARR